MIEIQLPDHSEQLVKAKELLKKVDKDMKWHRDTLVDIPATKRKTMVYITDTVLGVVGDLSQTRFDIRDSLEEQYTRKYIKSPALGKELFLQHYDSLHEDYNKVKNKCFDLLSKIDPEGKIVDTL